MTSTLAILFGMPGWAEILILCLIGVLIFGKRLPEVGRNLGKGIVEFKKGLAGIESDVDKAGQDRPQDEAPRQVSRDAGAAGPSLETQARTPDRTEQG